jgi:hypothetical protein
MAAVLGHCGQSPSTLFLSTFYPFALALSPPALPYSSWSGAVRRVEPVGADLVAGGLTGGEIRAINDEPALAPADRWGQLTHGP